MSHARKVRACFFPFALFGSGGAAAGADAISDAFQLMLDDNEGESRPTRSSAYMDHIHVEEFVLDQMDAIVSWREDARRVVREVLDDGDHLFWITGNHLGVLPLYDELSATKETVVIQFDAHLDVYNLADCTEELSHGNYLLFCDGAPPPIVNVGHRDLFLPQEQVGRYFTKAFSAAEIAIDPEPALAYLVDFTRGAKRVLVDLDCDVFDSAFFPASAQPLPMGLSPQLLLRFLNIVWSDRVVGIAVSEFEPARDQNDRSLTTLIWLLEYLLLRLYEKN